MPPASKLTPKLSKSLCGYISHGLTIKDACRLTGVHPSTLARWRNPDYEPNSPIHQQLALDLEEAESAFKRVHVDVIERAALLPSTVTREIIKEHPDGSVTKDVTTETRPPKWTASAWLLERRFPAEFGRRLEHSGDIQLGGVMVAPAEKTVNEWLEEQEAQNATKRAPTEGATLVRE